MSIISPATGWSKYKWRAASSRKGRILMAGILCCSAVCTLAGTAALFRFDQTAGAVSAVPVRWPASSDMQRPTRGGTLLVFVHPYCSCSVATLHEIALLSANGNSRSGHPATTVLFYRPKNSKWVPGSLWNKVEREIPGAHEVWDEGGGEARRFGARTSGYTILYDAKGDLLFKGGVTGSRGHEGANLGMDQLRASIDTGRAAPRASLVFGCALFGADVPENGEDR
jgi:hypothetical protein